MPDMAAPGGQPPAAAPMSAPSPQAGLKEQALVKMRLGAKVIEQAVAGLGFDSPEGKAAIKILGLMAKHFGKHEDGADELVPEEAKQLAQAAGGKQGPPGMPPGGPPGGGMPPGMAVPGVGKLPGM